MSTLFVVNGVLTSDYYSLYPFTLVYQLVGSAAVTFCSRNIEEKAAVRIIMVADNANSFFLFSIFIPLLGHVWDGGHVY
jgi:hypothetical protein